MKFAFWRKQPQHDSHFDEWLETFVKRNEGHVLYTRLGSEGGADINEVRKDLREWYPQYLNRELPEEMRATLEALGEFEHHPRDADENRERRHRALIEDWNRRWLKYVGIERDTIPPTLSGWSFGYKDFSGIDLTHADLRPMEGLRGLGSDHTRTNFSRALLTRANLEANILNQADLRDVDLNGARLVQAKLQGAKLIGADLRRAVLDEADLTGADMWGCDLTGASIANAILDGADLRFARGIVVDRNSVYRTKFSTGMWLNRRIRNHFYRKLRGCGAWDSDRPIPWAEPEDVWSGLRRVYTGPNFFITLLFLVAFAGSYLIRAEVLDQIGKSEATVISAIPTRLREELPRWAVSPEEATQIRARLPGEYQELETSFDNVLRETRSLTRDVPKAGALSADLAKEMVGSIGDIASHMELNHTVLLDLNGDLTRLLGRQATSAQSAQIRLRLPIEYGRVAADLANLLEAVHRTETIARGIPSSPAITALSDLSQSVAHIDAGIQQTGALVTVVRDDVMHLLASTISHSRWKIWQILLGVDTGSYLATAFIIVFIFYNGLRWFLTVTVAPLRDLEERSHTTPSRAEYYWLRRPNWVVSGLFYLSWIAGLAGLIGLMRHTVYIFW
jgi:uncharacterized protein YjbI with pentapeptide repeats